MTHMVSQKDIARLHLDLEVPSFLSVILEKHEILCLEDMKILGRAFAGMDSLETLVSVACCFQVVSSYLRHETEMFEPLLLHAEFILDDYAQYLMTSSLPDGDEWEIYLQEDLQNLSEFLALLSAASHGLHPALGAICEILNEQVVEKSDRVIMPQRLVMTGGNVIRFPVERRA